MNHTITLDRYDLVLLDALQRNADATHAELAATVHLSASQISRRLQRLRDSQLVAGCVALLDPHAIGLGVTAFAQVILERHGRMQSHAFENAVAAIAEVTECFSLTGDADYLLRIVARDLTAFSELMMERVLHLPGVTHVKSSIVLQTVKQTHVLPLDHLAQPSQPRLQIRFASE